VTADGETQLKEEEVIEGEAAAGCRDLCFVLGEVDGSEGVGKMQECSSRSNRFGERVCHFQGMGVHDPPQERAEGALGEPFGEAIDRNDPTGVQALIVRLLNDLEVGVPHLKGTAPEVSDLSVEHQALPALQDLFKIRLVEPDRPEIARTVAKQGLDRSSQSSFGRKAQVDDGSRAGLNDTDLEGAEWGQTAPVLMAVGDEEERIFDGL
jgi:hypothetical protein